MVAALQNRADAIEAQHDALKSEFRNFRIWIIIGTAASILGTIDRYIHRDQEKSDHPPVTVPVQQPPSNTVTGGSVTIGMDAPAETRREYLTTEDVAKKERVSQRTVTAWIQEGRIDPKPVQSNRAWQIAVDYRILPLTADAEK